MPYKYIIDFDSTFIRSEALEELSRICLDGSKEALVRDIGRITRLGMEGKLPFGDSLSMRLEILKPHRRHIDLLTKRLRKLVSPSFERNKEFIQRENRNIFIVSGGFREFIEPVVFPFGILRDRVLANSFVFGPDGIVSGYDTRNPLSGPKGKAIAVTDLKLEGVVIAVGDGWSDYEIKKYGAADLFFAYTETSRREPVVRHADRTVSSFDELIDWINAGS